METAGTGVDGRRHQQGEWRLGGDSRKEGQKWSKGRGGGTWLMGTDTRKGSEGLGNIPEITMKSSSVTKIFYVKWNVPHPRSSVIRPPENPVSANYFFFKSRRT